MKRDGVPVSVAVPLPLSVNPNHVGKAVDEIAEACEWVSDQSVHASSCQESELLIRASHVSLL